MAAVSHFEKVLKALTLERSTFIPTWRELADNILGYRGRFLVTDRNKGHKRNTNQYNNTPKRAARVLQSGLLSSATSPARPWFRLMTQDPSLREYGPVKIWLEQVEKLLFEIFAESNFYNVKSQQYGDLGVFGTAPYAIYENFQNVIFCQSFPIGSYCLGVNGQGVVDTMYREYQLQVGPLVRQFGLDNVSLSVKLMWERSEYQQWVDVVHAVEPNDDRDHYSFAASDLPFRSVYYEKANNSGNPRGSNIFLRQSGFHEFPIMAPRWDVAGEDIYATDCPGMMAIGDCKALQKTEVKGDKAIDKAVEPPLQAPSAMRGRRISLVSGDVSYVDSNVPGQKIESIYNVRPEIEPILRKAATIEGRINSAFYVDLFLMFQDLGNRDRVTAEEIARKHEEKLLMLGPMTERMLHEDLDPGVQRTFNIASRANILPDPPPELQNQTLKIDYISTLFQAQKMVVGQTIERTAAFVGQMTMEGQNPDALDKFDSDQAIDEYAEAIGSPAKIIRSDDQVAEIRANREKQKQMQMAAQAAESAVPATAAAKNLADADTEGKNALTDMMAAAG